MTLLDRDQVLSTNQVADWLRDQLATTSDPDARRAQQLILANFTICWTKYQSMNTNLSAVFNREYLSSLFIELRQAAWMVRITAWLYRHAPGWDPTWFRMEPEETG